MATIDFTTSQLWTVPAGVSSINVVCIGAGGGVSSGADRGGGGGAASSLNPTLAVTAGESLNITVGTGGDSTGGGGGGSSIDRSGSVLISANGGSGATTFGGGGGGSTGGVGTTKYAGAPGTTGGAGGGAAGATGAGSGSTGNSPGGAGGGPGIVELGAYTSTSENGYPYGGGAGGGDGTASLPVGGTSGANGLVRVTYTEPPGSGSLAVTIAAITVSASGALALAGNLASTIADITLAASASIAMGGSLTASIGEVSANLSGVGYATMTGEMFATIDPFTVSASAVSGTYMGDVSVSAKARNYSPTTIALNLQAIPDPHADVLDSELWDPFYIG